jgi:hypothetical protein
MTELLATFASVKLAVAGADIVVDALAQFALVQLDEGVGAVAELEVATDA